MQIIIELLKAFFVVRKKFHYDEDGFNAYGYNKEGYNREGFNKKGYDKDGYDQEGYNQDGYDRNGYNQKGYDQEGYDRNGYDQDGYNVIGYDCNGYDCYGYDVYGFNKRGIDREGYNKEFYCKAFEETNDLLKKAKEQMRKKNFDYALHDIRVGMEKCIKCLIYHYDSDSIASTLDKNITYCKNNDLLDSELIKKLYAAKNICNKLQHDTDETIEYNTVHFCYKVLEDLLKDVKEDMGL